MLLRKLLRESFYTRRFIFCRYKSSDQQKDNLVLLCKHLDVSERKAKYIQLKLPYLKRVGNEDIENLIAAVHEIGYPKDVLIEHPNLFALLPITLKNRYKVLEECGFRNIKPEQLLSYLTIIKQKTIGDLKKSSLLPLMVNVENMLASCMTQWPTSLTTLINEDVNVITLYNLRLKIIQRYLELTLDLTKEEFYRGLQTYPTIKHRPLKAINEVLMMLQAQICLPNHKIKSNLYLIHVDPENLKKILFSVKYLGGIDVREVIRSFPKIATKNYSTLIEIKNVLDKHGITSEAQARCLQIYTLSPKTIDERLEHAKSTPDISVFINHPRFLKMIYFNKTVLKRLTELHIKNKKCLSLNILSGSSLRYETFGKTPGDRLGKGKDLIFSVCEFFGKKYTMSELRHSLKRHPFWINIPLVEVKYVCNKLSKMFSSQDIFENCPILLYPWYKIEMALNTIQSDKHMNGVQLTDISSSQKLSLVLYILEKNHYFSGNGVWTEKHRKNVDHSTDAKFIQQVENQNI